MKQASEVATNSMRVFILSLLAVAAAHASAPAAWGGAHVTTLGKVDASSGSNLALRGGFVDTIKNMVSLALFPCRRVNQSASKHIYHVDIIRAHCIVTLNSHFLYNSPGNY
jgi:hypothetical protein